VSGGAVNSLLGQVERVPVKSLSFYPGNPRVGNVPVIADSLRENGQYAPLVVQASTRHVLAGNHTLKAAISLGWDEVDIVLVDADDKRARKIVLSANRTADLGTYDDDALAGLLAALDGDYEGTGWDVHDIGDLADKLGDGNDDAPTDEMPERWGVIVECQTEAQQARLLAELDGQGFSVRALMA